MTLSDIYLLNAEMLARFFRKRAHSIAEFAESGIEDRGFIRSYKAVRSANTAGLWAKRIKANPLEGLTPKMRF